jgi:hypothetical protein
VFLFTQASSVSSTPGSEDDDDDFYFASGSKRHVCDTDSDVKKKKQVKKQKKEKKKKKQATETAVVKRAVVKGLETIITTLRKSLHETDSGSASPSPSPCSSTSTPPRVPKHKYKRQSAASQLKATRQLAENSDMTATHFTTASGAEYTCPLHLGTDSDAERQFNSCRGQRLTEVPSTVSLRVHVHTIVGDGDCLLRYVGLRTHDARNLRQTHELRQTHTMA